jgi:HK97 family phage portal protein
METNMINLLKHFSTKKAVPESLFSYWGINDPHWTSCKYEEASENGFQKNVIAFRAINLISRSISSIPMVVKNCEDMQENIELTTLLKRPNSFQSYSSFIEAIVNYLLISGNVFIHCGDDGQLRCLRTDRVQIVPNSSKTDVDCYTYSVDSSKFMLEKQSIMHIKFFNPLNDWYGFSPLQAALRYIDQHNAMVDHNVSILQNGGRPSGCLIIKNGEENLTNEQREQLRFDLRNAYAGTANAGKIMILEGAFEWKEMGLSPKDLDFESGKNIASSEIAQAFGVPPVLLGLQQKNSTFGSYKEARLHLWEDTIIPLAELIRAEFSNWLSSRFNCKVEVVLDLDSVSALSSKREALWNKVSSADFLTINEKRKILGFLPINDDAINNNSNEKQ